MYSLVLENYMLDTNSSLWVESCVCDACMCVCFPSLISHSLHCFRRCSTLCYLITEVFYRQLMLLIHLLAEVTSC